MTPFDAWRDEQVAAFQKACNDAASAYRDARELTNEAFWQYDNATLIDEARRARELWLQRRDYEWTVSRFFEAASAARQAVLELSIKAKKEREIEGGK